MMTKKIFTLILILAGAMQLPLHAQKFSKREQAKKEARAINYFHGSSFTVTTGYLHSWMTDGLISPASTQPFGKSEYYKNAHEAFDLGFLWDHAFSRHWGMQHGLYYTQKGGEMVEYFDNGFGVGPIPVGRESIAIGGLELQSMARFFIPLTYHSRLSINGGFYLTKMLNETDKGVRKWDMGLMCGLGYDWKHLSVSVNYQPGLYTKICDNSKVKMNALMFNVGYRFWKE